MEAKIRSEILALERELTAAEKNKDIKNLEQLLDDDFSGLMYDGSVVNKKGFIHKTVSNPLNFKTLELKNIIITTDKKKVMVQADTLYEAYYEEKIVAGKMKYKGVWVERYPTYKLLKADISNG